MHDMACFGEVLWDVYGTDYNAGGAPFNVAAISSMLGLRSAVLSAVGEDELGERLIQEVEKRHVTSLITKTSAPTGTVTITLDRDGKPAFDIASCVAYDYIPAVDGVRDFTYFYYGTLASRVCEGVSHRSLRGILQNTHAVKIYDPNLRQGIPWHTLAPELLAYANVVKMSDEELRCFRELLAKAVHVASQVATVKGAIPDSSFIFQ